MVISRRLLSHTIWQKLNYVKTLNKEIKSLSSLAESVKNEAKPENEEYKKECNTQLPKSSMFSNYRHIYPEFLPDPNPLYRNSIREKLERIDMLTRRSVVTLPEFYVGSILAVTYSEKHATGKVNRFVGICILREGCGLRASFILRNCIDKEGVEVRYNLYDPAIQKIECLKLEKRLDNELLYLRDAPPEYSTFAFDMETEHLPEGAPVPVNDIQVTLKPQPWTEKWERMDLKGVKDIVVNERRRRKAKAVATPWEKYDLMKIYRETIPEEEQNELFSEIYTDLSHLEVKKNIMKRKRVFSRPKKVV